MIIKCNTILKIFIYYMILNFILSGLLFSIIHFVVNTLNNTAQGAMISVVPIGFLSILLILKFTYSVYRNIIFVIIGHYLSVLFSLIKYLPQVNKKIIITFITLLVIQLINYKYNIKMNPILFLNQIFHLINKFLRNIIKIILKQIN